MNRVNNDISRDIKNSLHGQNALHICQIRLGRQPFNTGNKVCQSQFDKLYIIIIDKKNMKIKLCLGPMSHVGGINTT